MNHLEEIMQALASAPLIMVTKPDNNLRQRVWAETYLTELKKTGSVICASADADEQLAKFDSLFTKQTIL